MNTFSLFYRSFFDTSLVSSYVKNGKGIGLTALFILSCVFSVVLSVFSYTAVSGLSFEMLQPLVKEMPEVVIKDGEIVSPVNYKKEFIFPEEDAFFIFDTTDDPILFDELPATGVYVTKDELVSVNGYETRSISFKSIQADELKINQENLKIWFNAGQEYLKKFLPVFVLFFFVPVMFFMYGLCLFIFVLVSYFYTLFFKKEISFDERVRLTLISIIPYLIINLVLLFTAVELGFWIKILIPLVYMFCSFRKFSELTAQAQA